MQLPLDININKWRIKHEIITLQRETIEQSESTCIITYKSIRHTCCLHPRVFITPKQYGVISLEHASFISLAFGAAILDATHSTKLVRQLRKQDSIKMTSFSSTERHKYLQLPLFWISLLLSLTLRGPKLIFPYIHQHRYLTSSKRGSPNIIWMIESRRMS